MLFWDITFKIIFTLVGVATIYRGVTNMWEAREIVTEVQARLEHECYAQTVYNRVYLEELLSGVCEILAGLGFIVLLWLHVK